MGRVASLTDAISMLRESTLMFLAEHLPVTASSPWCTHAQAHTLCYWRKCFPAEQPPACPLLLLTPSGPHISEYVFGWTWHALKHRPRCHRQADSHLSTVSAAQGFNLWFLTLWSLLCWCVIAATEPFSQEGLREPPFRLSKQHVLP